MTREEEIKKVASEYADDYGTFNCDQDDVFTGFFDGAKWADEHPRPLSEDVIKNILAEHEDWHYEQWHCDVNEKCSFYEWYLKHREL